MTTCDTGRAISDNRHLILAEPAAERFHKRINIRRFAIRTVKMLALDHRITLSPHPAGLHPVQIFETISAVKDRMILVCALLFQHPIHHTQEIFCICMNRKINVNARFFEFLCVDITDNHIGLARPGLVIISDLTDA